MQHNVYYVAFLIVYNLIITYLFKLHKCFEILNFLQLKMAEMQAIYTLPQCNIIFIMLHFLFYIFFLILIFIFCFYSTLLE